MQFDRFYALAADLPELSFEVACSILGAPREHTRVQLHRWCATGRLLRLRRGLYVFGEPWRRRQLTPERVASLLVDRSYLSGLWALSDTGMIPEAVFTLTSVTTQRAPGRYQNEFGQFTYQTIKEDFYWGFQTLDTPAGAVRIAEPEKALADFFWLNPGEWPAERIEAELRLQPCECFSPNKARAYARRSGSVRLQSHIETALSVVAKAGEGWTSWKEAAG